MVFLSKKCYYITGLKNKNRFLELTLGKENADAKPSDLFGNKYLDISGKELYEQMNLELISCKVLHS